MDCGGVPGEYDHDVYLTFADQVGWYRSGDRLSYDKLTFLLQDSKQGHLPVVEGQDIPVGKIPLWMDWSEDGYKWGFRLFRLFSRVATCNL
jgi:hypothetical protein